MRYVLPCVLLCAGLRLAAQEPAAPTVQSGPTFRSTSSELVVLPVTVTDRNGQLVTDLPREHFVVYDQNRPQPVAAFSNEDIPVSISLVIDDSGSMRRRLPEVIAATLAFARWSHHEDELTVVEFNDAVRDALDGRSLAAGDLPALEAALKTLRPEGQTALYDALMAGLDHLDASPRARRVLVLISDGGDNASRSTLPMVLERAHRSNVTIYAIGLFDQESRDSNPGVLRQLADATGGERFLPKSPGPLMAACERIAREIRHSYTVGYAPPDQDGRYHQLRVSVADAGRRGLRVRTRPGYVAGNGAAR